MVRWPSSETPSELYCSSGRTWPSTDHDTDNHYKFQLPSHKADCFFEGNRILIKKDQFSNLNPLAVFKDYLNSRDFLHPLSSPLWLTSKGTIPARHFFMTRLHCFFDHDIGGHSMRAGGATSLAENGVCYNCIYTHTIYLFFFFTFTLGTTCYESMFFYFYYSSCIMRILYASDAWLSYMLFPLCWTHVEHVLTMRYAHVFTYIKCS